MGYIYPGTITKGKVEGKEYSKIIEWLYNLSKNKDAWGIIDKWDLRKKDLEQLHPILENKDLSSKEKKLIKNYLERVNLKVSKINSIVKGYNILHEEKERLSLKSKRSWDELESLHENGQTLSVEDHYLTDLIISDLKSGYKPDRETVAKSKAVISKQIELGRKTLETLDRHGIDFNESHQACLEWSKKIQEFLTEVNSLADTLKEVCELYQTLTKK